MPIYEYECLACGRRTEAIQRVGDPPLASCAECGGELKKLISSPAFQFKGSGWYVTDYARAKPEGKTDKAADDGGGKAAGADAKPKGDAAPAGKAGGESKAAAAKD